MGVSFFGWFERGSRKEHTFFSPSSSSSCFLKMGGGGPKEGRPNLGQTWDPQRLPRSGEVLPGAPGSKARASG